MDAFVSRRGELHVAYHLHQKTFQVWFLSSMQPLNCDPKIRLNPLIHLSSAVLKHHFDELRSWLDVTILQIFISHDLCMKIKRSADIIIQEREQKNHRK